MRPTEALPVWLEFFRFSSANAVYVLIGCVALATSAGVVGSFAFLRRRSLIGDTLAHAALPGICTAFLLTGTKDPLIILAGAAMSCWLGALTVDWIVRYTRCKEDSALGMTLSVFFGVGIVLLTRIQQTGSAAQAGLEHFTFGRAADLVAADVRVIVPISMGLCGLVVLAYKELKVTAFDPEYADAVGVRRRPVEIGLATATVLAVAIGLQAVGVVLMAALLVTPAAAARCWTERLGVMLALAGAFGALAGFTGAYASYLSPGMPTGPWIVLSITGLFVVSALLAPNRGLVPRVLRQASHRRRARDENLLGALYRLGEDERGWGESYTAGELLLRQSMSPRSLRQALHSLLGRGHIRRETGARYALTDSGASEAARLLRNHRLWETYLARKLELAPDHLHADADEVEHVITPELEARLAETLADPDEDPHAKRIPAPRLEDGSGARNR